MKSWAVLPGFLASSVFSIYYVPKGVALFSKHFVLVGHVTGSEDNSAGIFLCPSPTLSPARLRKAQPLSHCSPANVEAVLMAMLVPWQPCFHFLTTAYL